MKRLFLVAVLLSLIAVAQAQQPAGVWEGEISDPRRPVVISADFGARRISFSGGTPIAFKLLVDSVADKSITFEVMTGGQALRFAGSEKEDGRITGEADIGGRRIPFWLDLLPSVPKPTNHAEAWRQDLDVVIIRFLRYDRSFTERHRAAARARLLRLRRNVQNLPDAAIIVELARAVGMSGNAHTRLYLMRNRTEVRRVPIRVWWFGNELRIVRADAQHADLAGCRVTRIGRFDTLTAFRKVKGIKAGNSSWQRYMTAYFLTSPDLLFGAGVIASADRLPLRVACSQGQREVTLTPLPLQRSSTPVEAWKDLAPADQSIEPNFKSALASESAPLYLKHPDQNYWTEYLSGSDIVYVQYNRAQEMSGEPMANFVQRVTRLLDEHSVKGVIIDVRFNTGGDLGVGTPLLETLAARLKGKRAVVITGRNTFSAGITHAVQWKQLANAFIVGEPVGDGLDMWSEGGNLVLPNCGLTVHYANGFHTYSAKEYPAFKPYFADFNVASVAPDQPVENTWRDYLSGHDRALAAAVAYINNRRLLRN